MPLTAWIESHRDRLRAFCEAQGRPLFILEAPPEMTALAARVVASLEADDLSEEMIFGYSAPFAEGADANAWLEGIAASVEANLDEQRPKLEEAGVELPVTMGLDRWCAAPGVTTAHLVADYLDRVARLAQRHTRRVMVVLHAEECSPERSIALARALASCVGGDRVKVLCLVESTSPIAALDEALAPLPSSRRLQVEEAALMLHDARASIDELVASPTRRVLSLTGDAQQVASALHAPQLHGHDPRVRAVRIAVPCGQPMPFSRAAVRALAAVRAEHLGHTEGDLATDVADPNLGPEGVLADFAERVARVVCRDDQVMLVAVEPSPLEDASLYGSSMVALAAAAASPRVRWVLLDPSRGGALPVLWERERPVEHARLEVTPDAMESGLASKLEDPSLPDMERMRLSLALAGFAIGRRDFDRALALQDGALGIAQSMNSPADEAAALLSVGHTFYVSERWPDAKTAFTRAAELAMDAERDPLAAQALTNLGHTQLCAGEHAEAETCYRTAGDWFERMGALVQAAHARTWLGESLRRQSRTHEAEETWRGVVEAYDAIGPDFAAATKVGRAEVVERLARLSESVGRRDAAAQWRHTQHDHSETPVVMDRP